MRSHGFLRQGKQQKYASDQPHAANRALPGAPGKTAALGKIVEFTQPQAGQYQHNQHKG